MMNFKTVTAALVIALGTSAAIASAQDAPPPCPTMDCPEMQMGTPKGMPPMNGKMNSMMPREKGGAMDSMLTPEAREKIEKLQKEIDSIRKADMNAAMQSRKAMRQMIDEYKTKPSPELKEKIMKELSARFDAQIKLREKRLEAEKAKKADELEARFKKMIEAPAEMQMPPPDNQGKGAMRREKTQNQERRMKREHRPESKNDKAPAPKA